MSSTNDKMWDAPDIIPTITYTDFLPAIEWLQRVFGFHERTEARLNWSGGGRTWFEVGNSLFCIATPDKKPGQNAEPSGLMMKAYVQDVDKHFAHAKEEGQKLFLNPKMGFGEGESTVC